MLNLVQHLNLKNDILNQIQDVKQNICDEKRRLFLFRENCKKVQF